MSLRLWVRPAPPQRVWRSPTAAAGLSLVPASSVIYGDDGREQIYFLFFERQI
jgi:hypothetical protein